MLPLPYPLLRAFLFRLDPEAAHHLMLHTLSHWQASRLAPLLSNTLPPDPVQLAGLTFPNRVGLAAGLDKDARCIDGLALLGFGFIEVGTVTPRAQAGNKRPRMFRVPRAKALINRMGFNNEGLERFVSHLRDSRWWQARCKGGVAAAPMLLGLNIGKNASTPIAEAEHDYEHALEAVYPYADYVAINISSPNTQQLRSLQTDAALDGLLAAMQRTRARLQRETDLYRPLFVKIAPDLEPAQVDAIAHALQRHGMDGVIATNTTLARDAIKDEPNANEAGGLSGAPLREASDRVVRELRAALGPDYPIIGVGGIMSGADARAKRQAGADVVQIYTGLIYRGPALVREVGAALAAR